MNYTFIILGILLVVVLYVLYKTLLAPTSVVQTQTYLQSIPKPVPLSTLTNANSVDYYYSLWVYVNNLNAPGVGVNAANTILVPGFETSKPMKLANNIFYIADNKNETTYLSLDVKESTELVTHLMVKKPADKLVEYIITPNFSLQRWEHVIISVNQSYLDLYLDGKLIKSANLGVNPTQAPVNVSSPAKINFGNGDFYIAGFQRIANAMDPQTAWSIYLSGSGTTKNPLNYGLSMTLSKNNTPKATIDLF